MCCLCLLLLLKNTVYTMRFTFIDPKWIFWPILVSNDISIHRCKQVKNSSSEATK